MNQNELKIAEKLVGNLNNKFDCPVCSYPFELAPMVKFQLRCSKCLLRLTVYVDEGASRIFDKQRQVEKPVAVKPVQKAKPIPVKSGPAIKLKNLDKPSQSTIDAKKLTMSQESALEMVREFRHRGKNGSKKQKSKGKPQRAKKSRPS